MRNISEDVAKLPLILYRRLKPRGKERASELALYRLLKDSPNVEMTAIDFRQSIMVDALLGGNGFAEIVKNAGGLAVELHKLARNRVTVTRDAAGRLVYVVRNDGKPDSILQQDQMLHIRGLGDGLVGWSVIRLARESIGLAMNAETSSRSSAASSAGRASATDRSLRVRSASVSSLIARMVACCTSAPAVTTPWPRSRQASASAMAAATALPSSRVLMSTALGYTGTPRTASSIAPGS